jgi:uncharacterized phage protein (TIGR02218 family)
MTYLAQETGGATAQPVELYRWTHATEIYTYTSGQEAEVLDGETYVPAAIRRGQINQGEEINRATLEVTLAQDHPVALLFSLGPPVDRVLLTLSRRHVTDAAAEAVTIWQGRVLSCEWSRVQAVLRHEPVWTALRRVGLRRTWGYQCPHLLGGSACGVVLAGFEGAGTVTAVAAATVTVSGAEAQPDGYWSGGMLSAYPIATGRTLRAMILGHTGTDLTLHIPLGLIPGDAVTLSPGCDHSLDGAGGCDARFANAANFGGFPWTPEVSPYGGTVVY